MISFLFCFIVCLVHTTSSAGLSLHYLNDHKGNKYMTLKCNRIIVPQLWSKITTQQESINGIITELLTNILQSTIYNEIMPCINLDSDSFTTIDLSFKLLELIADAYKATSSTSEKVQLIRKIFSHQNIIDTQIYANAVNITTFKRLQRIGQHINTLFRGEPDHELMLEMFLNSMYYEQYIKLISVSLEYRYHIGQRLVYPETLVLEVFQVTSKGYVTLKIFDDTKQCIREQEILKLITNKTITLHQGCSDNKNRIRVPRILNNEINCDNVNAFFLEFIHDGVPLKYIDTFTEQNASMMLQSLSNTINHVSELGIADFYITEDTIIIDDKGRYWLTGFISNGINFNTLDLSKSLIDTDRFECLSPQLWKLEEIRRDLLAQNSSSSSSGVTEEMTNLIRNAGFYSLELVAFYRLAMEIKSEWTLFQLQNQLRMNMINDVYKLSEHVLNEKMYEEMNGLWLSIATWIEENKYLRNELFPVILNGNYHIDASFIFTPLSDKEVPMILSRSKSRRFSRRFSFSGTNSKLDDATMPSMQSIRTRSESISYSEIPSDLSGTKGLKGGRFKSFKKRVSLPNIKEKQSFSTI